MRNFNALKPFIKAYIKDIIINHISAVVLLNSGEEIIITTETAKELISELLDHAPATKSQEKEG